MKYLILLLIVIPEWGNAQNGRIPNPPYQRDEGHREPLQQAPLREADVMYSKRIWRVIDVKEKMNQPFAYPRAPLAEALFEQAKAGELAVYDASVGNGLEQRLSRDRVQAILVKYDTVVMYDDVGEELRIPIVNEVSPQSVDRYVIMEDWVFDEQRSTMRTFIRGIAPVRAVTDPTTGEFRGYSVLFWVYYPEAKPLLANTWAYNPRNDAIQMSWYDIFEMRMFSSFISKESNVHDREIETYATGIDVVLESERIKMELFRWEHELWSF